MMSSKLDNLENIEIALNTSIKRLDKMEEKFADMDTNEENL